MPPTKTTEDIWAWLADCPLDPCYFGQIILTVRAGAVVEVEQRQVHRRPRQQGGQSPPEERSEQLTPHRH
jgi:hypothetical protein